MLFSKSISFLEAELLFIKSSLFLAARLGSELLVSSFKSKQSASNCGIEIKNLKYKPQLTPITTAAKTINANQDLLAHRHFIHHRIPKTSLKRR
ncbi:hypothetical protein HanXRQr2_Chr01g0037271 [Helianthus annuus]|uniref:Uncharacterized protein n=1 Tax=Helianthus annuus TaxID=4232 RepID=A0A9K3JYG9_HELAN|nr:hypothetical protein HanXRQr2_Chr01g0037271 [Helianthus annuus]KAJ0958142.1 hypothetical protein HanPSC8_Chr01g0035691 [Helianthus annuus]